MKIKVNFTRCKHGINKSCGPECAPKTWNDDILDGADKLHAVSYLLTTQSTTVHVYDLGKHPKYEGMMFIVKKTKGKELRRTQKFEKVWKMIVKEIANKPQCGRDAAKAFKEISECEESSKYDPI